MKKLGLIFIFIMALCVFGATYADELIVYTQPTDNYWQLWVYNFAQNLHKQLTASLYDKKNPVWSLDGNRILFRSGNGELFVLDMSIGKEEKILKEVQYCADPSWVTDDEILFTRYRTDIIDDSDIWLVNLRTGERKVLISEPGLQFQPNISKDKENLVYVSALTSQNHQIFIKNLKTGEKKQVTQGESYNFLPSFSPDGKEIAFVSNQTRNNEIYKIDISSKNIKQLTQNTGIDTDPKWIDNKRIIYSRYEKGKFQINLLNLETMETAPLIVKETDCCNPDWINK